MLLHYKRNKNVNNLFIFVIQNASITVYQQHYQSIRLVLINFKELPPHMQEEVRKSFEAAKPPSMIFLLMILTNILINLDHGILPACNSELAKDYDMNQTEVGLLGSIVYLGISVMGMFAGRLYQHFNSKMLTVVSLIVLQVSLLCFVFFQEKYAAYGTRFITGVCQVFLLVYYPIWIDKFGGDKKTMWLTLLQICVPIGIFMGYGMTAIIISTGYSYTLSFYIQVGMVTCFIIAFFFLSNKKLDSRRKLSEELTDAMLDQYQESVLSTLTQQQTKQQQKKKYKLSYMFCRLMKSKMYLVGTFTMAVILYVSTGVQFWLTNYFIEVLHFDQQSVFIAYAIVSFTGPTTGCGFGGYAINRIGGYENPITIYYVFVFASIGIGAAVFIPFVQNFYLITSLLWIVLFFGGAMMPGLTGIMMVSVSPYLRAFGNSTGEIIKNIFGYFPSPFIYGLFNSLINERAGIKFLMFWGLWAPLLLFLGSIHKYRHMKRQAELKKLKEQKGLNVPEEPQYSDLEDSDEKVLQNQEDVEKSNQTTIPSKESPVQPVSPPSAKQHGGAIQSEKVVKQVSKGTTITS